MLFIVRLFPFEALQGELAFHEHSSFLTVCLSVCLSVCSIAPKGYLIQKKETAAVLGLENGKTFTAVGGGGEREKSDLVTNVEFHPMLFRQHCSAHYQELETFDKVRRW